jgi:DNA-binding beta-propeller fold protein YncE
VRVPSVSRNPLTSAAAVVLLAVTMLFPGTAGAKDKKPAAPAAPPIDLSKLAWPPEPDVARIKYQGMYRGEDDINPAGVRKHKSSWMDKMAGVSLPQDAGKPRVQAPYGVATDSQGRIYVADSKGGAIFVFDLDNKKVEYRGSQKLQLPSGLAVDDSDRLFVSDSESHIIFVFKPDGGVEGVFGADRLVRPVGLAIDDENRFLYAVDAKANRVAVFDADTYKFLRYIAEKATTDPLGPGVLNSPNSAAVDSEGNVYVTDTFNARVQVFDAEGNFLRMWGKPGNIVGCFMRPKGIAIDRDDHVYVVDAEFNNVQVFNTEGWALLAFGTRGLEPGTFTLAAGIGIDRKFDRIIVTDQWAPRMQVFAYTPDSVAVKEYEKAAKEAKEKAEREQAEREKRVLGDAKDAAPRK